MDPDVQQAIEELKAGMLQGFKELQDGMLAMAQARKADADKLADLQKKVDTLKATPRPVTIPRPQPKKIEESFKDKLMKALLS